MTEGTETVEVARAWVETATKVVMLDLAVAVTVTVALEAAMAASVEAARRVAVAAG